jgi:hypothetical protein
MLLDPFIKVQLYFQIFIITDDFSNTPEQVKGLEDTKDYTVVSFPEKTAGKEESEYFGEKQSHNNKCLKCLKCT